MRVPETALREFNLSIHRPGWRSKDARRGPFPVRASAKRAAWPLENTGAWRGIDE
jgi:hypothetical protein